MEMLTMPTLECCLLTNYHKPSHGRGKNLTIPPSINDYIVCAQKSSPDTNFKIKLKNSRTFFLFLHCITRCCARCNCLGGSGVEHYK